jgi:hypothetical protein
MSEKELTLIGSTNLFEYNVTPIVKTLARLIKNGKLKQGDKVGIEITQENIEAYTNSENMEQLMKNLGITNKLEFVKTMKYDSMRTEFALIKYFQKKGLVPVSLREPRNEKVEKHINFFVEQILNNPNSSIRKTARERLAEFLSIKEKMRLTRIIERKLPTVAIVPEDLVHQIKIPQLKLNVVDLTQQLDKERHQKNRVAMMKRIRERREANIKKRKRERAIERRKNPIRRTRLK